MDGDQIIGMYIYNYGYTANQPLSNYHITISIHNTSQTDKGFTFTPVQRSRVRSYLYKAPYDENEATLNMYKNKIQNELRDKALANNMDTTNISAQEVLDTVVQIGFGDLYAELPNNKQVKQYS